MKTFHLEPTSNPDLSRVVDINGDWRHYFHSPSGTFLRAVNAILEDGYAKGTRFYAYLKNKSAAEIDEKLSAACSKGDGVHQFIDIIFKHPKLPNRMTPVVNEEGELRILTWEEWEAVLSFQTFWNLHRPVLFDHEQAVCNLKLGYAGTYDARLKLTKACGNQFCKCEKFIGKVGIYDWKTGGGIYSNYGAQIASYEKARPGDYTAILRLGTKHRTGYEFQPYNRRETNRHFQEFKSALVIANAEYKPFDPKKEIYEIPEKLDLVVEREQKPELDQTKILPFEGAK